MAWHFMLTNAILLSSIPMFVSSGLPCLGWHHSAFVQNVTELKSLLHQTLGVRQWLHKWRNKEINYIVEVRDFLQTYTPVLLHEFNSSVVLEHKFQCKLSHWSHHLPLLWAGTACAPVTVIIYFQRLGKKFE